MGVGRRRQRRQLPVSGTSATGPPPELDSAGEKRAAWRKEAAARLELTPREAEVLTDEDYEYLERRAQQASLADPTNNEHTSSEVTWARLVRTC